MTIRPILAVILCLPLFVTNSFARADTTAPPLANAVILIIRHAEKPLTGPGLTPAGEKRANAYIQYFENYQIDSKLRPPDYLVASADTKRSERPRLTIEPLSKATSLAIDNKFADDDYASLAQELQTKPSGKTILMCWHHGEIPGLLQALGADPNSLLPGGTWPDDVFNWVIQVRFDADGHIIASKCVRINEKLFPGDAD